MCPLQHVQSLSKTRRAALIVTISAENGRRHAEISVRCVSSLAIITCSSVRGGDLHGVRGNVGGVGPAVLAGAGERYALLVAGELDELAELLLSEHLQGGPEELNVLVGLHQTHLIHGVSLRWGSGG